MSKKVVVFGGSGFLGSHVADYLTEVGHEVTIFDVKESEFLKSNQEMIVGNILDADLVSKVVEGKDIVYNFAGIADLDSSTTQPMETVRLNIEGTVNLLEACRHVKVKRFIFASTIYVYSHKGGFYRCSKQSAETYIEEYSNVYGVDFTVLRYGTLYGPRANESNSVFRYVSQALKTHKVVIPGDGEEMREYIHVRDAARLSVEILNPEYRNKYFVITGHHPLQLKQLVATIKEILNAPLKIEYKPKKNAHHYSMTPYSYIPKIGRKLTSNCYTDIGQGLLDCFQEVHLRIDKNEVKS